MYKRSWTDSLFGQVWLFAVSEEAKCVLLCTCFDGGEGGRGERGRERVTVMFALSGQVENINTCLTFLATLGVSVEGVSAKGTDLSSDTWTFSLLSPAPFCRPPLPPTSSPTALSPLPVLSSYSISFALRSVCLCSCLCLSLCLSTHISDLL